MKRRYAGRFLRFSCSHTFVLCKIELHCSLLCVVAGGVGGSLLYALCTVIIIFRVDKTGGTATEVLWRRN